MWVLVIVKPRITRVKTGKDSVHPRSSGAVSAVGLLDPTEPAFQSVEFSLHGEL